MGEAEPMDEVVNPPSQQAQEKEIITFAKRLAANEKKGRDEALARLKVWLSKKPNLDELDLMKIWKGLFYCLWMSDKAPVQEELASSISKLVHCFGEDVDRVHLFLVTCYRTLRREWNKLDKYRLDKYYSFLRLLHREVLVLLKSRSYQPSWVKKAYLPLEAEVLLQPWPNALRLHACDLLLPELEKVDGEGISTDDFFTLLAPFFRLLSSCPDQTVFDRALDRVLLDFVRTRRARKQEGEEGGPYFPKVDAEALQARVFDMASAVETRERYRESLYKAHKEYQKLTGVRLAAKRPREEEEEEPAAAVASSSPSKAAKKAADATPGKATKEQQGKKKKGKKEEEEAVAMEVDDTEPPAEKKMTKKEKKAAAAKAAREEEAAKESAKAAVAKAGQADKKPAAKAGGKEGAKAGGEAAKAAVAKAEKEGQPSGKKQKKEVKEAATEQQKPEGKKLKKKEGGEGTAMEVEEEAAKQPAKGKKGKEAAAKVEKGKEAEGGKKKQKKAAEEGSAMEVDGAGQQGKAKKGAKKDEAAAGEKKGAKKAGDAAAAAEGGKKAEKPPQFIASPKFAGRKPNYKFQKGKQGVGYYWDKVQAEGPVAKKKVTFGKVHVKLFQRDQPGPRGTISFMPKKQQQQKGGKKHFNKKGGRPRASSYF